VALERGVNLDGHCSKVVGTELACDFDLIVVMEPRQERALRRQVPGCPPVLVLGDLDPLTSDARTIPDPWGKDLDEFRASFDRIDRCLVELRPFLAKSP
jgi:protein-tyrosine-phosphatase